jgi:tetratricopeptide (TPR) repeat protein
MAIVLVEKVSTLKTDMGVPIVGKMQGDVAGVNFVNRVDSCPVAVCLRNGLLNRRGSPMSRFAPFLICAFTCILLGLPCVADDPPKQLTSEERKELDAKWEESMNAGVGAKQLKKYPEARKSLEAALEMARRLYPETEFPDGHFKLAANLNLLGQLYQELGNYSEAEPLYRDVLDMNKRLYKGGHRLVANSLNNLGTLYRDLGRYAKAEPLFREALDMNKRLYKGDHPIVANSFNSLTIQYKNKNQ